MEIFSSSLEASEIIMGDKSAHGSGLVAHRPAQRRASGAHPPDFNARIPPRSAAALPTN
jgi:hypothetical protein